jgi:glycosyltransferase involved in cell wall biosynthesis
MTALPHEPPVARDGSNGHHQPDAVLIVDHLANNGAVHITVDLARRWAAGGSVLGVLHRLPDPSAEIPVPAGCEVHQLTEPRPPAWSKLPRATVRLTRLGRSRSVLIGGSEIGPGLILGYLAARLSGRPFVVAVHADLDDALAEWIPPRQHRLYRFVHRRVDGAICVAPALADPLRRNGLPADRIAVVRNGIDTEAVRAAAAGPGSLVADDRPTIVATGRLAHQKAYDVLIRAHGRLVGELPHRVLLLNDGPERAGLEALAVDLGVRDTVEFAGAVRAPLPSVADAAAFCLPSRHEGLPLALLEAICLGVPCIATDSSAGVRDVLDDGRIGRILPVDDVEALTQALRAHLSDPQPLRRMAALGPAHAAQFDRGVMADSWQVAIERFVSARRRQRWWRRRR